MKTDLIKICKIENHACQVNVYYQNFLDKIMMFSICQSWDIKRKKELQYTCVEEGTTVYMCRRWNNSIHV